MTPRYMIEANKYAEPVPIETKGLSDHLREQMMMLDLTPRQRLIAEEFIGNIAEDGYIGASLEEIVGCANNLLQQYADQSDDQQPVEPYTVADAEAMLRIIQKLDP